MTKQRWIRLAAVTAAVFHFSTAQFRTDVSVSTMMDDNVNNNAEQIRSAVSVFDLSAGYDHADGPSEWRFGYDGSFQYFDALVSRTNHLHSLSAEYFHYSGAEEENRLRLLGTLGIGVNRDLYSAFDHSMGSLAVEYKSFLTDWFIQKWGYAYRQYDYVNLQDFSYSEHLFSVNNAAAAGPSTTIILQADLGTKFYSTESAGSSNVQRKGVISSVMPSVTQVTGLFRVGQGITDDIGVSFALKYQWNIQKQTRYLTSEYGFISDDELFDDHYGYEGLHPFLQYTHRFSESSTGRVVAGSQQRIYSSLPAYDLLGNVIALQREDQRNYLNLLYEQRLESFGFILRTSLDVIQNVSNDPFFDYRNTALTVEIGVPF